MAGVVVTAQAQAAPNSAAQALPGQVFMVGLAERGDTTKPIKISSLAEAQSLLGNRVTYGSLYDQLQTFFAEGGKQAYVARVVGASSTSGSLTLSDRAGSPVATLKVDAANPGSWSTNITVEVKNGGLPNTFRMIVTLAGVVVHDFNNISSPSEAVQRFNGSPYVNVSNLGSATSSPNNNPAVVAATNASGGNDQRGSVSATDYVTALARFSPDLGTGAVCIPGQGNATVWQGLITHAEVNNRIALLANPIASSVTDYTSTADDYSSPSAGMFGPWVIIPDGAGGSRTISPEGYVAAARARAIDQIGPWRVPAGSLSRANFIQGLEVVYSDNDMNTLEAGNVSPIRFVAGSVRLYGWASLSTDDTNWQYLKERDLLNWMIYETERRLEDYTFETVDAKGRLMADIKGALTAMCEPIATAGGLYQNINHATGEVVDPGYVVIIDGTVNTPQTLSQNRVNAELKVRVSPTAGLITIQITKTGLLQSF